MKKIILPEKPIFYLILIILIGVWLNYLFFRFSAVESARRNVNEELALIAARSELTLPVSQPDTVAEIKVSVENFKDPFAYSIFEKPVIEGQTFDIHQFSQGSPINITNLSLTGIVNINNTRYAIINDNIVREGDLIFGAYVLRISTDKAVLRYEDQLYEIKMKKSEE